MRAPCPRRSSRRGSAAVEFALTAPVLLLIIFGVIDYSWYIKQATDVVHATRQGLRAGVKLPRTEGPDAAAEAQATTVLQTYGIDCSSTHRCRIRASRTQLEGLFAVVLHVQVEYEPLIGLVPLPELLGAEVTMALENQS